MATDLTGTPTSLGIGTYNTSADAPSGLGFNAAMAQIDALLAARVSKPSGIVSGEVPVWNGSTWVRSSVTNIGAASLGSGTPDSTKFLRGDGAWQVPPAPFSPTPLVLSTQEARGIIWTGSAFASGLNSYSDLMSITFGGTTNAGIKVDFLGGITNNFEGSGITQDSGVRTIGPFATLASTATTTVGTTTVTFKWTNVSGNTYKLQFAPTGGNGTLAGFAGLFIVKLFSI